MSYDTRGDRLGIMCIGDSITVGQNSTVPGGYRDSLIAQITNYMGIPPDVYGWSTAGNLGPNRMVGVSGERTALVRARTALECPAFANQVDCAFLHIGTNDTTQLANTGGPNTVNQSMGFLTQILDDLRSANPNCIVFIAQIVDNQTWHSAFVTYNAALVSTVQARSDYLAGKVVLVDMYTALGLWSATYFGDATHPNAAGYALMANTWYTAFRTKF